MTHYNADLTEAEGLELMEHIHKWLLTEPSRRPGAAGRDDIGYAHLAAAYVILVNAGSTRPVAEITEAANALLAALQAQR